MNWWQKQPVTIKAAVIGGIPVILAALIPLVVELRQAPAAPAPAVAQSATTAAPEVPSLVEEKRSSSAQSTVRCDGAVHAMTLDPDREYTLNADGRCTLLLRIAEGKLFEEGGFPLTAQYVDSFWGWMGAQVRQVHTGPEGAEIEFVFCLTADMDKGADSSGCRTTEPAVIVR